MNKHSIATFIILLYSLVWATHVIAQAKDQEPTKWETKLDVFQRKIGVVLVKGSSQIGTVKGGGGEVQVQAIEYLDTSSGERASGVELFLSANNGSYTQIDYDEIDSLVKAIERLASLDKSTTGLEKYVATYRTRGNVTVSRFTEAPSGKGISAAVDGNAIGGGTVFLTVEGLGNFKRLVTEAKTKLDSLRTQKK